MGHHLEPRTSAEAEAWANTKEGLAGSGTRLRSKHAKHIHVHTDSPICRLVWDNTGKTVSPVWLAYAGRHSKTGIFLNGFRRYGEDQVRWIDQVRKIDLKVEKL